MTPEYLACSTTNTQLEPIRRVIEASLPGREDPFSEQDRQVDRGSEACYDRFEQRIRPVRTSTSLENPFLCLSANEYKTLRRFQDERQLPSRFLGQTSAQDNVLHASIRPPPANPTFQTSNQEYGKYNPNVHTMPNSYHGLNTRFTAKKTTQGNFRNHSLNM